MLKVLVVIPSVEGQGLLPLDSQDHTVTQDLWDSLAMWVLLGLQDVKERRVLWGLWASLVYQVLLVIMVPLETQEMLVSKDLLGLKESQVLLVIQVSQAMGWRRGQASFWSSTASQFWCQSALKAAISFGWATVWSTWRDKRRLTLKIWARLVPASLFSPPCLSPTATKLPVTSPVATTNPIGSPPQLPYP